MAESRRSPTRSAHRQSEQAEIDAQRAAKAARLFDIRRLIGGLFLIYGVILVILGLGESDASIAKAADININLYAGLGMLVAGLLLHRLGADAPARRAELERVRAARRRARGRPRWRRRGRAAPGGEQGQHRAAEAAAHHPRAGRAGALEALDGRLDLGDRGLVVVAQARVGLVEQAADRLEVARAQRLDGGVDARVLAQHVAGAPAARLGEPLRRRGVGGAQVLDAELARRRLALGAALVVARRRRARARRRSRPSRAASRAGRAGRARSRAWRSRSAARGPPRRAATRAGRAARSRRRPSRSRPASRASPARAGRAPRRPRRRAARGTAPSRAPPRRTGPEPCGTSPVNVTRAGTSSTPAAVSSATMPRANARQPSARSGPASGKASGSPRSSATTSKRSPSSGSAVAVTPRSIANGSARPPL